MGHLAFAMVSANSSERTCIRRSRLLANVIPFLRNNMEEGVRLHAKERNTQSDSDEVSLMLLSQQACLLQSNQNAILSLVDKKQVSQSPSEGIMMEMVVSWPAPNDVKITEDVVTLTRGD